MVIADRRKRIESSQLLHRVSVTPDRGWKCSGHLIRITGHLIIFKNRFEQWTERQIVAIRDGRWNERGKIQPFSLRRLRPDVMIPDHPPSNILLDIKKHDHCDQPRQTDQPLSYVPAPRERRFLNCAHDYLTGPSRTRFSQKHNHLIRHCFRQLLRTVFGSLPLAIREDERQKIFQTAPPDGPFVASIHRRKRVADTSPGQSFIQLLVGLDCPVGFAAHKPQQLQ